MSKWISEGSLMLYNTVDESVKVSAGIKIWDDGLFFLPTR